MNNRVNILGVYFDTYVMYDAVAYGLSLFKKEGKHIIFTPNPEIVMAAYEDLTLRKILNKGSLVIPDGIGIVIGSKIIGRPIKERVAGFDFMQLLFDSLQNTDETVYFYGAKPGVAKKAAKIMQKKYPKLKIIGTQNGYEKDMDKIIKDINEKKPSFLMVGLGAPAQERWIEKYLDQLDVKVIAGVGGTFDGISGNVKRAPKIFIKLNLEWFHRLITQPSRWRRMLKLPLFIWKMIIEGRRYE